MDEGVNGDNFDNEDDDYDNVVSAFLYHHETVENSYVITSLWNVDFEFKRLLKYTNCLMIIYMK